LMVDMHALVQRVREKITTLPVAASLKRKINVLPAPKRSRSYPV